MSRRARVSIVQFGKDEHDPHENLAAMKRDVERYRESDLIVFPELSLHGHDITHDHESKLRTAFRAVSEAEIQDFHDFIREQDARVIYGELVERGGRLYNLATYTDGRERMSYAKTHVHWSEPFEPGEEFPIVETPFGSLGMLICFDAAFPEVPRLLAIRGAKMIVNISAIPEHFPLKYVHRRLVGCSMENQVFTIFANRTGEGFAGGSAIVDPRGEIVALAKADEHSITAELNLREVDEWRQEEPLLPNRRPHLYTELAQR